MHGAVIRHDLIRHLQVDLQQHSRHESGLPLNKALPHKRTGSSCSHICLQVGPERSRQGIVGQPLQSIRVRQVARNRECHLLRGCAQDVRAHHPSFASTHAARASWCTELAHHAPHRLNHIAGLRTTCWRVGHSEHLPHQSNEYQSAAMRKVSVNTRTWVKSQLMQRTSRHIDRMGRREVPRRQ